VRRWGYWVHDAYFKKGCQHQLKITADTERSVTATVSNVLKGQDLGVQF
jgi:hypothetical protein